MTPAEHYAEAERWLSLADQALNDVGSIMVDGRPHDYKMAMYRAQVHATLATVPTFPERRIVRIDDCICSHLAGEPLAKTATHPDCPIHGEKG